MKGFIVYPTYRIIDNKAYIYLFGRLENNKSFLIKRFYEPYFYIKEADIRKVPKTEIDYRIEKTEKKDFKDNRVAKIITNIPKNIPHLRKSFEEKGILCYEADIRFEYRFMIDYDIRSYIDIEGEHYVKDNLWVFEEAKIKSVYSKNDLVTEIPELSIASFDIEVVDDKIISIAIHDGKKTYSYIVNKGMKNSVKDERELILKFIEKIRELDPDIITGWNIIDYDFFMINEKCKKYNIPLNIGRTDEPMKLHIESLYYRDSKADAPGRMVLDGIHILKSSFIKLDDYRLKTAAKEILRESKLLDGISEIENAYKDNPKKLLEYNEKDAELVYQILKKTDSINLTIQRSILTGMPLDRVNSSIATLDNLYLRELKDRVAYSSEYREKPDDSLGGYVMEPKPGIYDYVIVCDFKSLYPSIIRTFNIDPMSLIENCKEKKSNNEVTVAPNGACFRKGEFILPKIIERLWKQRDLAKKNKNKLASYAIKIHMNSIYGVLGNPNCRFYSFKMSNAITHFGQHLIKTVANKIRNMGYDVIYGDTDSVFIDLSVKDYESAKEIGEDIQNRINTFLKDYIKKEYYCESKLELEFEKIYEKLIMPYSRSMKTGAKKRYAGLLIDGNAKKVDITGLEFVRRDWTKLAKTFQMKILEKIFSNLDPTSFIKNFVRELKTGKYDNLLIYSKSLRKETKDYTKTTPPHVKAARMLEANNIPVPYVIKYIMTKNGPEPIELAKGEIDYEHYIEKQLKPIADSILVFYNKNFDDIIRGNEQSSLFEF